MKALVLEGIKKVTVCDVPMPALGALGAVVRVLANGVCRSDWHMWIGDLVRPPGTVLGHEMAGIVEEVALGVTKFKKGDRVVVPFSSCDATCGNCQRGFTHLCDNAQLAAKHYGGGYAEYVSIPLADHNLVHLPEQISFTDGAALGCRFMTSFHGLVERATIRPGEWVAIYGCGGIGLSAINIAAASGCQVIGIDVNPANLALARELGAAHVIDSRGASPVEAVMELTQGGVHVSVDALGIAETCVNSVRSLRKRGRHLQIGVTTKTEGGIIGVPTDEMVRKELTFLGSFGMPAHEYASMIQMVVDRRLQPGRLVTEEIALSDVESVFEKMTNFAVSGTYVVTRFQ